MRIIFLSIVCLLAANLFAKVGLSSCRISSVGKLRVGEAYRIWNEIAVQAWPDLKTLNPPKFLLAEEACLGIFEGNPGKLVSGSKYNRFFQALDGQNGSFSPLAYANYIENNPSKESFFVMTSVEAWKQHPKFSEIDDATDVILTIIIHELFHTYQLSQNFFRSFEKKMAIDSRPMWKAFKENTEWQKLLKKESDILWQAIHKKKTIDKLSLGKEFLNVREMRRKKFLKNDKAKYLELAPVSLTLEGVAEWIRYRVIAEIGKFKSNPKLVKSDPHYKSLQRFRKLSDSESLEYVWNNRNWEKKIGFGLSVLVSQLNPNWQKSVHSSSPSLLETQLATIVESQKSH